MVLRSEPGPGDETHYASVTAWLDRQIYYPVKVEKVVKISGEVKEFIYYGLRQVRGVWSASQIECKVSGKAGSSLLIINRGAENPHLDRLGVRPRTFDQTLIRHQLACRLAMRERPPWLCRKPA